MNEKQIIEIARIKLPLVVEIMNKANLEAQKQKPDLDALSNLLSHDDLDGFYDVDQLVSGYIRNVRIIGKFEGSKEQ